MEKKKQSRSTKGPVVQMTLREYMKKTMLDELKGPPGQAMIKRLTEILTF